jgi:hypothetical protein
LLAPELVRRPLVTVDLRTAIAHLRLDLVEFLDRIGERLRCRRQHKPRREQRSTRHRPSTTSARHRPASPENKEAPEAATLGQDTRQRTNREPRIGQVDRRTGSQPFFVWFATDWMRA